LPELSKEQQTTIKKALAVLKQDLPPLSSEPEWHE
jgi:hypothetical protein